MLSWGMLRFAAVNPRSIRARLALAAVDRAIRDRRINRRRGTLVGGSLETCSTMKSMHIYAAARRGPSGLLSEELGTVLSGGEGTARLASRARKSARARLTGIASSRVNATRSNTRMGSLSG